MSEPREEKGGGASLPLVDNNAAKRPINKERSGWTFAPLAEVLLETLLDNEGPQPLTTLVKAVEWKTQHTWGIRDIEGLTLTLLQQLADNELIAREQPLGFSEAGYGPATENGSATENNKWTLACKAGESLNITIGESTYTLCIREKYLRTDRVKQSFDKGELIKAVQSVVQRGNHALLARQMGKTPKEIDLDELNKVLGRVLKSVSEHGFGYLNHTLKDKAIIKDALLQCAEACGIDDLGKDEQEQVSTGPNVTAQAREHIQHLTRGDAEPVHFEVRPEQMVKKGAHTKKTEHSIKWTPAAKAKVIQMREQQIAEGRRHWDYQEVIDYLHLNSHGLTTRDLEVLDPQRIRSIYETHRDAEKKKKRKLTQG